MKGEDRLEETTATREADVEASVAEDRKLVARASRLAAASVAEDPELLAAVSRVSEALSQLTIAARAAEDHELMEAVVRVSEALSRLAAARYYRAFLTRSLRTPLNQVQKRVARIERMLERSVR